MSIRKTQITALLDIPFISLILKYDYFLEGVPRLIHHEKYSIDHVAALPNNRAVYTTHNEVKIINLHNRVVEYTLTGHKRYINILYVNNNLIATVSEYSLKIWDLITKNYIYNSQERIGIVHTMLFHDKYLYYDKRNKVIKLDLLTHEEIIYHLDTDKTIKQLFVMANRLIVVNGIINVFNLLTGKLIYTLGKYIKYVKQIDENNIISSSYYHGNKTYNIITGRSENIFQNISIAISSILILPDKRVVVLFDSGGIFIFENLNKKQYVLGRCYNSTKHMAVLFDGNIVTSGNENVLRILDPNTGQHLFTIKSKDATTILIVSDTGQLITTNYNGNLIIWQ